VAIQFVTYNGQIIGVCTARRMHLTYIPPADAAETPARLFIAMCLYAGGILNGDRPGPYRDDDARSWARRALIPSELLEAPHTIDQRETAHWLGVPEEEVRIAQRLARR
jgi:hypothetical protein